MEGQAASDLFAVCSGQVKLSTSSLEEKAIILRIAEAGELLGLPATLSGKPYEVTAEESERVRVNFIPRAAFLSFLSAHPEAVIQVAQLLTDSHYAGHEVIGTQALGPNSPGWIELEKGQTLTTGSGKVEVLLTPGVFLRVADNSSVRMISPDLGNTEVAVEKGRAAVEVLEIRKENNIRSPRMMRTQNCWIRACMTSMQATIRFVFSREKQTCLWEARKSR
jgi:hypothetical protein